MKRIISVLSLVFILASSAFASGAPIELPDDPLFPGTVLYGDANGDKTLNNKDVVLLFRIVSGSDVRYEKKLDFNRDKTVNNKDVVALFRYVSDH